MSQLSSIMRSHISTQQSCLQPSKTLLNKQFSTVRVHTKVLMTYRTTSKRAIHVQASSQEDADIDLPSPLPEPDTARAAIAIGLKLTEANRWEEAQDFFERALNLPGTGIKRFRDKPPQLSDGERIACMFNLACCQSRLGEEENIQNGLMAIAGCLEAGYDNWQQLRTDPDLENLRKNEKFEGLMKKFQGKAGGFGNFFKNM
jgi:hypothetical protein